MPPTSLAPMPTLDDLILALTAVRNREPALGAKSVEIRWDPGFATLGGHPAVKITSVQLGFDWDHGRIFLGTSEPVGKVNASLRRMLREQENTLGRLYLAAARDEIKPAITLRKLRQILEAHRKKQVETFESPADFA